MDASKESELKGDGSLGEIAFLEFVESPDVVLTKPVETYVQHEAG